MDSSLDKRMKFRESIRRKAIQEIKKSKRQLFQKEFQKMRVEAEEEKLYHSIINNSHQVFQEKENYLQLLREALNWEKIGRYKSMLSEVLLNLVKFYDNSQFSQETLILFIECMAMIYYETNIQFDQLTKRCLNICDEMFQKSKVGEGNQKLIRVRCIVAICNITCTTNEQILKYSQELNLLEKLDLYLEDFPAEDKEKVNILSIYGNLINYHLAYQYGESYVPTYYPFLLKQCIEGNYNSEVLEKATEAVTNLLKLQCLDKVDIIQNMDCLFAILLQADFYVEESQELLMVASQYFASQNDFENRNFDFSVIFERLFQLLEFFSRRFPHNVSNVAIVKSFFCISVITHKYFQESEDQKLEELTTRLCNYWTDLQDDTSFEFELYFLKFLRLSLSNLNVTSAIYQQYERGIEEDNAIKAPTWEIIVQFLIKVRVETSDSIFEFLNVLNIPNFNQMIGPQSKECINQKIEGCYYSQMNDSQISRLAESVLQTYTLNESL